MNSEKRNLLQNLNPSNFKLANKIQLLIFSLVLLTIIIMVLLGFFMLHSIMIKNAFSHLNETSYLKSKEIELRIKSVDDRFHEFIGQEKVRYAAEEFITAFQDLDQAGSELPEINELKAELSTYYENEIAPLAPFTTNKVLNYLPGSEPALVAQYKYIYLNPKPVGEKEKYIFSEDFNSYSQTHGSYQLFFQSFKDRIGARDLKLVDPQSGDIVYTVTKNIDLGSNLYDGPFKNDAISTAFRKAVSGNKSQSCFIDYTQYVAALDQPVAFLSIPLYFFDELKAVFILEFGAELLDNMLFDEYSLERSTTLTFDIVGDDLRLRNNPKDYLKNSEDYLERIKRKAKKHDLEYSMKYGQTGSLSLFTAYPPKYKDKLLALQDAAIIDYNAKHVLCNVASFELLGINYRLITKINRSEALLNYFDQVKIFAVVIMALLFLTFFTGRFFGRSLTDRINFLLTALKELYNGEKSKNIKAGAPDEFGKTIEAYNLLRKRINSAEEFAIEMSEGNYNYRFDILGERDSLGKSLNVLKERLIKSRDEENARKLEDDIRNWINTGIAKFNDLLRQNTNDIKVLSYSIIKNMVEYLDANQGGVFLVEGDTDAEKKIELIAGYAYNREKHHRKSIEINEGLLGSVYMEKKPVYLKDVPEDYIEITSGIGQATPRVLYIAPLKIDEDVLGMIEVASFSEFEPHNIEFIEKVSESIAATLVSVRLNMKTALLLEESNRRAEENAQQEEEMRQNLEEMQTTQEELARLRQDDEKRTREMQLIIDNTRNLVKNITNAVPGGITLKDSNGVIHFANDEGAEYYGAPVDTIIGKTDHELLDSSTYKTEQDNDESVLKDGDKQYTEESEVKGKKVKYNVIKKQFEIEEIHQTGVLTIRIKK